MENDEEAERFGEKMVKEMREKWEKNEMKREKDMSQMKLVLIKWSGSLVNEVD